MVTLLRSVELPDRKVDATCDLYIGGDHATEREFHHIARHEFDGRAWTCHRSDTAAHPLPLGPR
jgi:hypothetical protein